MRVTSSLLPNSTQSSQADVLILKHAQRRVLVGVPKTFQDLITVSRELFALAPEVNLTFETDDLNICQQVAVEIHPTCWDAISLALCTVNIKTERAIKNTVREPAVERVVGRAPSVPVMATEIPVNPSSGSSVDDDMVNIPSDDLYDDELYEEGDDTEVSPMKGKGRARQRIESEEEEEEEEEEEDIMPGSSTQPTIESAIPAMSSVKTSLVRAAPASASHVLTPKDNVRDMFSPNGKTALSYDKDDWNTMGKNTDNVGAGSPSLDRISKSKGTPQKAVKYPSLDATPAPKFKPQVAHPADALPDGKILITIAHPSSGQESKFKVKGKHLVGRVLASACAAFKIDATHAKLLIQTEDDGVEMSYECKIDESMAEAGADNGSHFTIQD
ncbi:hypothetical protein BV25DRAFT_1916552 [Artomyces pyxidatus]|uniref:Uncharacterized protein n=1 Tax=Artomyces pyxidatus TaxID=48021 RepID=A0ACB8SZI9_9AGAM|nr:hypothetical protein BV25DRAFT_1916552 [Artomyces pyxidatus]